MSSDENREFTVALCGFSEREQNAFSSAFKLSAARPRHYSRWLRGPARPDLCLLNEDLPEGFDGWTAICETLRRTDFPVIRIGAANKNPERFHEVKSAFVKRPVLASRVLKALDEMVIEVYHYAPELAIRDDMPSNAIPDRMDERTEAQARMAKRILVVDDSESVRKMMEVRLLQEGYSVDFAETGEEAISKVQERTYDLIFLDVMLPGISGYDVSKHLKREFRIQAPVVMLTGKTSRIDKLRGSLASADAYLTKPLAIESLNETLKRYLH